MMGNEPYVREVTYMKDALMDVLDIFADERHFRLRLFFEGAALGVLTGNVVAAFRWLLQTADVMRPGFYVFLKENMAYALPFFAVLFIVGLLLWKIVKLEPMISGSGIPQVKGILLGEMHMRWAHVVLLKFIGGVLAIGVGGMSLGREGPSVQLGACVGQGIGRGLHRTRSEGRYLLTAGGGAGLAAAFNAPLAGVVFCLEELQKNFSPLVLMAAITAAVTSTAVTRMVFGGAPVFHLGEIPVIPMDGTYFLLVALGLFTGAVSMAFNPMLRVSLDWYRALPVRPWMKPVLPLMMSGMLGFFMPEVLGGGNLLVDSIVTADYALPILLLLFAVKFTFLMVCFGSGVPGGIFLPMLVLGALCGAVFAKGAEAVGVMPAYYMTDCVAFAMAAYFAAVVKSPVTGSILIMEMTGSFEHMLAIITVAMSAYMVTDMTGGQPVYDMLLARSLRIRDHIRKHMRRHRVAVELVAGAGSSVVGRRIGDIAFPKHVVLVNVRRGMSEHVPSSDFELIPGDYLYFLTDDTDVACLTAMVKERIRDK